MFTTMVFAEPSSDIKRHTAFDGGNPFVSSPQVSSMERYGDCTEDLFHGRIGLQIPLFEYKDQDFDIPVILGYSTQGFQPGRASGPVGIGWNINVGGSITKDVRGLPDEEKDVTKLWKWNGDRNKTGIPINTQEYVDSYTPNLSYSSMGVSGYAAIWSMDSLEYAGLNEIDYYYDGALDSEYGLYYPTEQAVGIARNGVETQSDIYHFNFMGYNGDFILQPCGKFAVFNSNIPAGCVDIDWNWNESQPQQSTFTISVGDGKKYVFSLREGSSSFDASYGQEIGSDTPQNWLLTRIMAPNGQTVEFRYRGMTSYSYCPSLIVDWMQRRGQTGGSWRSWIEGDNSSWIVPPAASVITSVVSGFLIDTIIVKDRATIAFGVDDDGMISEVSVHNCLGKKVRHAELEYDGSLLESVRIDGRGEWSFSYYGNQSDYPSRDTKETDNMGFYNGTDSYCRLSVPTSHIWGALLPYAENIQQRRTANFNCSCIGALKTVHWPTGGYSEFGYGLNKVYENGLEKNFYGIRLESQEDYSSPGTLLRSTRYLYEDEEGVCSGKKLRFPQIYFRYTVNTAGYRIEREAVSTANSTGLSADEIIEYSSVKELISGSSEDDGIAIITHKYGQTQTNALSDLTEHYTSWDPDGAVCDDNWTYEYHNTRSFIDSQMMGESYMAGKELHMEERDSLLHRTVRRQANHFSLKNIQTTCSQEPALMSGRYVIHMNNPKFTYLGVNTEEYYGDNGSYVRTNTTDLDTKCRVCRQSDGIDEINTLYFETVPLFPSLVSKETGSLDGTHEYLSERYFYRNIGNGYSPNYMPDRYETKDEDEDSWRIDGRILEYDSYGNPTEVVDKNGTHTIWEWGYAGQYPVRKSVVQGNDMEPLTTTWEWLPLVGIIKCVEPTGVTTEYEYDSACRLIQKKVNGEPVSQAVYNISTENINE